MSDNLIDSTRNNFIKYLSSLGLSPKTHKNYRSDLGHFISWLILRVKSLGSYVTTLTEAVPFMNKNIVSEYKSYLIENNIPAKTINRRLSTLRHLTKYLAISNLISTDLMGGVENISDGIKVIKNTSDPLIDEFRAHLETEKVSKNTVKNYVSDVRQFLSWLEANQKNLNA
ncbi:MAG: site-specific integrase [Candidatus Woesebacteria bacterium]|nr:MAG: site-specific integrase [Candidatus Woesebacteria bacterium]